MTTLYIILAIVVFLLLLKKYVKIEFKDDERKVNKQHEAIPFYKVKKIRYFPIKGIGHQKSVESLDIGKFWGYAEVEDNIHDRFAVAIYKSTGKKIGYVPKGNHMLNRSIQEWHDGLCVAWGRIDYDDYYNRWTGEVNIPVGMDNTDVSLLQELHKLKVSYDQFRLTPESQDDDVFIMLSLPEKFSQLEEELSVANPFELHLKKNIIPGFSRRLEKEKKWNKLIRLENYSDQIDYLSDKFKAAVLSRIKHAKQIGS
jgi:hypothetical protein